MIRKGVAYWMDKVVTPGDWSIYFNANIALNYANIRFWVSASVQGALLAATRNRNGDSSQNVSIDPAFALAAGLAVSASRVLLAAHFHSARVIEECFNVAAWVL